MFTRHEARARGMSGRPRPRAAEVRVCRYRGFPADPSRARTSLGKGRHPSDDGAPLAEAAGGALNAAPKAAAQPHQEPSTGCPRVPEARAEAHAKPTDRPRGQPATMGAAAKERPTSVRDQYERLLKAPKPVMRIDGRVQASNRLYSKHRKTLEQTARRKPGSDKKGTDHTRARRVLRCLHFVDVNAMLRAGSPTRRRTSTCGSARKPMGPRRRPPTTKDNEK